MWEKVGIRAEFISGQVFLLIQARLQLHHPAISKLIKCFWEMPELDEGKIHPQRAVDAVHGQEEKERWKKAIH